MSETQRVTVVHGCPAEGEATTPCCGIPPLDLPRSHRITTDHTGVTCWTGDDPRITGVVR